jgi:hypothetical protein
MSRLVGLGIDRYFGILQNESLQLLIELFDGEFSSPLSSVSLTAPFLTRSATSAGLLGFSFTEVGFVILGKQ